MSTLLKQTVSTLNGRGGGSKDLAQGGISRREDIATALAAATQSLKIDSAN
jgi:alanyl-tRNA synthetase